MAPSPFASVDNYKHIVRGCLYWAVAPFQAEDPVNVFHPHPKSPSSGVMVPDSGLFHSGLEHPVVIPFKKRPVLVVQTDSLNHRPAYTYTVVALGQSFKDSEVGGPTYNAIKDGHLPNFLYIAEGIINPKEGYLSLSNLLMLHKSMLLGRITAASPFSPSQQTFIDHSIAKLLGLPGGGIGMPQQRSV